MARVYCMFKVCAYLQDYYHCYSFLVDNYLKKETKTFFSYHYNKIKKSRLKKSQTKTFSTLFHLPLSLSLQYTQPSHSPPYYGLPRSYSHSISLTLAPLPFHLLLSTSYSSLLPFYFPFHYRNPYLLLVSHMLLHLPLPNVPPCIKVRFLLKVDCTLTILQI